MWIVGVAAVLVVAAGAILWIDHGERPPHRPWLWDNVVTGSATTGIAGTLAGFTIASAIFLSEQVVVRGTGSFGNVIGLLLLAFLILVGAATLFSSIPGSASPDAVDPDSLRTQHLTSVIAAAAYYLGVSVAWLTLKPFLVAFRLFFLADVFTWLLLMVIVAGATRISLFLYRLTRTRAVAAIALAPVAAVVTVAYRLLAVPIPDLLPSTDAAFTFAVLGFLAAAPSFMAQTALLWVHADSRATPFLSRYGDRVVLVYLQSVVVVVALLWFAVAFP